MGPFQSGAWLWRGLLPLIIGIGVQGMARADHPNESAIKAGFVFNFIKFTQWPGARDDDRSPLRVCAVDANPLGGQLTLLQGRPVGLRTIDVRTQVAPGDWKACQVLYISEPDPVKVDAAIRSLGNAPILTVADVPNFVQLNGVIGLRLDDGRMRFDVNLGAAQRVGLQLNSQMVQLAGKVLR